LVPAGAQVDAARSEPSSASSPGALLAAVDAPPDFARPQLEREPAQESPATPAATARAPLEVRRRRPLSAWLQLVGVAALLYAALFHLSVVRGSSMSPAIHDGDRILIDPVSFMLQGVRRGDIVVLQYPLDPSIDYIKRVVGLPGDEIVIEQGDVWVNGERLSEPYVESPDPFCSLRTRVKPAHYFVLGDNRRRSCDSREFGQVPQGYVRGKVELCLWPPARAGWIGI
jgi:signal peptidase I